MQLSFQEEKPLYLQIAQGLEDGIVSGAFSEETQIPSTTEISVPYRTNPATALKGINLLVSQGVLYKKRGLGMFVAKGARQTLLQKRRESFYQSYVKTLIQEAKQLQLSREEIVALLERGLNE